MSLFDLTGKVALVTGSTRGIGEAIVRRLAEHGAKVVVSSRKADACERVARAINDAQRADVALPAPCNINYKEQLQALVEASRKKLGQIDVLEVRLSLLGGRQVVVRLLPQHLHVLDSGTHVAVQADNMVEVIVQRR